MLCVYVCVKGRYRRPIVCLNCVSCRHCGTSFQQHEPETSTFIPSMGFGGLYGKSRGRMLNRGTATWLAEDARSAGTPEASSLSQPRAP